MGIRGVLLPLVAVGLVATSCGGDVDTAGRRRSDGASLPATIEVTSSAFAEGRPIPERFSCEGENVSPPLAWSQVPDGAAELALVVSDPDAPGGTFYHWILLGIDPSTSSLGAGELPPRAVQARSSSGMATYIGMCPPDGTTHRYVFALYALNRRLEAPPDMEPADAVATIEKAAVAVGRLQGTFGR